MFPSHQERFDMTLAFNQKIRVNGITGYSANLLNHSPPTLTVSNCNGKLFDVFFNDDRVIVMLLGSVTNVERLIFQIAIDLMTEYRAAKFGSAVELAHYGAAFKSGKLLKFFF